MKTTCSNEACILTIQTQSVDSVYTDQYGFLDIKVSEFCFSGEPLKAVQLHCQNDFTLQNILLYSLTVVSYRINDNCCRELEHYC